MWMSMIHEVSISLLFIISSFKMISEYLIIFRYYDIKFRSRNVKLKLDVVLFERTKCRKKNNKERFWIGKKIIEQNTLPIENKHVSTLLTISINFRLLFIYFSDSFNRIINSLFYHAVFFFIIPLFRCPSLIFPSTFLFLPYVDNIFASYRNLFYRKFPS